MNSLIFRGYGRFDRIVTRGNGSGWLGIVRREVVQLISKFMKTIRISSKFNREIDGIKI